MAIIAPLFWARRRARLFESFRCDKIIVTQEDARAYLGVLVGDLLGSSHEYLLPCEAVFDHLKKPEKNVYGMVEQLKSKGQGMSSLYGPITEIEHLHAPYDADLIIERRFGPLMARLRGDLSGRSR